MPICPNCNLGIPPSFTVCPDCGRRLVEVAKSEPLEEIDAVEIRGLGDMLVDELPGHDAGTENLALLVDPQPEPEPFEPEPQPEPEPRAVSVEAEPRPRTHPRRPKRRPPPKRKPLRREKVVAVDLPDEDVFGPDQFVGTSRGFAQFEGRDEVRPSQFGSSRVRWAHRAYRGEIELTAHGSRAPFVLAVFGDGLLFIEMMSAGPAGRLRSRPLGRKRREQLTLAGSSAEGQTLAGGSRRLSVTEIESVRIEKASALQRQIDVQTKDEDVLRYRFSSRRYRHLVGLLSPVLGAKLTTDLADADRGTRRSVIS